MSDAARAEIEDDIRAFLAELPPAICEHQGFQLVAMLSGALAGLGHRRNLAVLLRTLADHAAAGPAGSRLQ